MRTKVSVLIHSIPSYKDPPLYWNCMTPFTVSSWISGRLMDLKMKWQSRSKCPVEILIFLRIVITNELVACVSRDTTQSISRECNTDFPFSEVPTVERNSFWLQVVHFLDMLILLCSYCYLGIFPKLNYHSQILSLSVDEGLGLH